MTKRIQRRRTKGWRKPDNAVIVTRPSKWGNPFPASEHGAAWAVREFRAWLSPSSVNRWPHLTERRDRLLRDIHELRGKDLACWCADGDPCHADTLIELANATASSDGT